jgi:hypothetical protein
MKSQTLQLFTENGARLAIGPWLASGGEAEIFALASDAARVLKLYRKPTPERERKLRAMLRAVPDDPQRHRNHISICWPEEIIFDSAGAAVGFLMPMLEMRTHRAVAIYWNPEDRALVAPGFTWKYLCIAASNIASMVELIHKMGHVVGDLNEENILVNNRALATVVDCDSMQIRDPDSGELFRSSVTREPYISPEAIGVELATYDRSEHDDCWALAVLVFQMLMEGHHPANGIGHPEERAVRVQRGFFPMIGEPGFRPPKYAVSFELLPESLKALFLRCFRDGFRTPAARPTAYEWRCELQHLGGALSQCTSVETHWHSPHLASCPWCEQVRVIGFDRFAPSAADSGAQTALAPLEAPQPPSAAAASGLPLSQVSSPSTPTRQSSVSSAGAIFGFGALAVALIVMVAVSKNSGSPSPGQGSDTTVIRSVPSERSASGPRPTNSPVETPPPPPVDLSTAASPASSAALGSSPSPPTPSPSPTPLPLDDQQRPRLFTPTGVSEPMLSITGGGFVVQYPVSWTAVNDNGAIRIHQTNATRRTSDGKPWVDYQFFAGRAPATSLQQVLENIQSRMLSLPGSTQFGSSSTQQTALGATISISFRVPNEFGYVEQTLMLIAARPDETFMVVQCDAPETQWSESWKIFARILDSISF